MRCEIIHRKVYSDHVRKERGCDTNQPHLAATSSKRKHEARNFAPLLVLIRELTVLRTSNLHRKVTNLNQDLTNSKRIALELLMSRRENDEATTRRKFWQAAAGPNET